MATELKIIIDHKKFTECECPLEVRYALQRNLEPFEGEDRLEPTDDAVYKIVVTNRGNGYAKDVKALAWLTATPPAGETIDVPDNLRVIPHGLVGQFELHAPPGAPAKFPDDLTAVPSELDLDEFVENARQHIPSLFHTNVEGLLHRCNVIRFGDIPAGRTKVACLTILSEGAPENTRYQIHLFFKFDCCRLVQVPVPVCRQVEYSEISGQIVQED